MRQTIAVVVGVISMIGLGCGEVERVRLRIVERKMSEEQVAEAQRLAREWLENHPKPAP